MGADAPLVLTYHSVAAGAGPTSMAPESFRMQMSALAAAGFASMTLQDFIDWRAGRTGGDGRVLITFDDAFQDFRDTAHPILREHGFSAVMFAPTGRLGSPEAWAGAPDPGRALMSWSDVEALAGEGVEFGAHGVSHTDLTTLSPEARQNEIEESGEALARRLGHPTLSFAAPYGRVNADVVADLRARYALAFGVRFARVRLADDPHDLPRIEMHYFRDPRRWRDFIAGRDGYFHARRLLRGARERLRPSVQA